MKGFTGDYSGRADQKNRLLIPSRFKSVLEGEGEGRAIVKKDLYEKCLLLYPIGVWESKVEDLQSRIDPYNRQHTQFMREFIRTTQEVSMDGNGRILLPKKLLDMIGADKDFTLLGLQDHIEIWDTATYESSKLTEQQIFELSDSLFGKDKKAREYGAE
ncbi:MAG: hypothetical protein II951_09950 [Bacteroidales bacterium]|jgi:MraZ protein|nr:hypothetical protein [Bacteroidales bacterium]